MAKLSVQIVTAEREVFSDTEADMVVAPGREGVLGILPRHAPLLTTLAPGEVRIKKDGQEVDIAVGGGFLQVANNRVLILADTAEREEELDESRAEAARQRAEQALKDALSGPPVQAEAARMALRRSMVRLQVARKRTRRPGPG
jgi:F-type H+-transporting ATPase subunit epsilon